MNRKFPQSYRGLGSGGFGKPKCKDLSANPTIDELIWFVNCKLVLEEYELAEEALFSLITHFESMASQQKYDYLVLRGTSYSIKGEIELALMDYDKAISLTTDHIWALLSRAQLFALTKNLEQMRKDLLHSIEIDSRIEVTTYCAKLFLVSRLDGLAWTIMLKAFLRKPWSPYVHALLPWMIWGVMQNRLVFALIWLLLIPIILLILADPLKYLFGIGLLSIFIGYCSILDWRLGYSAWKAVVRFALVFLSIVFFFNFIKIR